MDVRKKCETCNGTGKVNDKTCTACGGAGGIDTTTV